MRARPFALLALLASTSAALAGCGGGAPAADETDIVGGVDAKSAKLNAIGALGTQYGGSFSYFCTATLIGPRVVLTAKHCADSHDAGDVYFAVGPDTKAPLRTVRAKSVVLAPVDEGGFVSLGSDVAVYLLEEEITDVRPMRVASGHIPAEMEGQTFNVVGYGVQDNQGTSGTRRAGAVTLQAVSGKPMEKIFGTPEKFLEFMARSESEEYVESRREDLLEFYALELLPDYEAHVGMGPNDAQPCSGDSGGPLLKKEGAEHVVHAVVSGSKKGGRNRCSILGEFYATLGPAVQDMIGSMSGPCEGVPYAGTCEGTVAVRCVLPSEGLEKVTKVDCADLDQTCAIGEDGRAACVDAEGGEGGAGGEGGGSVATTGAGGEGGATVATVGAGGAGGQGGL